ncbi:class I SAM-dependent methyltransferase [Kitasatospora xanthocidica]|uniref:Class I SAM-dependent methyltransferase n=1 Tax=Kitasatospora xanthocidica TaxID=83382 RepID=A0A373A343_9ACTN|nr:class I SAM-dependent methyltransferase [Kitasatospora xanthocidica]
MQAAAPDLWHHYGRTRADTDRGVPDFFPWIWAQDGGPGSEVLGDVTGLVLADLGAGAARHAAHLVVHHAPARVDAIDASAAQHAMAGDLYGHLAPRLRTLHANAAEHLEAHPDEYDVLYSVFGGLDFADPRRLLPAAARALRPGGLLAAATLGHYLGGAPAEPDVQHADIPARTPDGTPATMRRWVLQEHVWTKLLDEAGFTAIGVDRLPPATSGARSADTLLLRARRHK